jgi:hypothetical protein
MELCGVLDRVLDRITGGATGGVLSNAETIHVNSNT